MHHLFALRKKQRQQKLVNALIAYAESLRAKVENERLIMQEQAKLDLIEQMESI